MQVKREQEFYIQNEQSGRQDYPTGQKGHIDKLPPKSKRKRLSKYAQLNKALPKGNVRPRRLHQKVKESHNPRPSSGYCAWYVKNMLK